MMSNFLYLKKRLQTFNHIYFFDIKLYLDNVQKWVKLLLLLVEFQSTVISKYYYSSTSQKEVWCSNS